MNDSQDVELSIGSIKRKITMKSLQALGEALIELNSIHSVFNLAVDANGNFYVTNGNFEIAVDGEWKYFGTNHFDCPFLAVTDTLNRLRAARFVRSNNTGERKYWTGEEWINIPE